ncbi:PREDICTED: nucleolar protein 56-like [Elephantulus edwardii]|uniref:nucleolar protein 56-like n=1 Tax=Elephantulus edwardii TaxID=28737 RepID=UPI0003F0738A|nr:PREDICTED: nucleolar protein 56-like [Elephantulus edwardii]
MEPSWWRAGHRQSYYEEHRALRREQADVSVERKGTYNVGVKEDKQVSPEDTGKTRMEPEVTSNWAEEVAVEITKKLEEKEKKRLKKEKKRLAALALVASENKGTLEDQECEETKEKPKKKKKKTPQEAPQENGMEDQSSSALPKPKKKKSLSKELVNSDFEEPTVNAKVPKRKKSSSREEPEDPEEVANSVPKKKKKLSKEEPVSSGPEEAINESTKKKKKRKKHPRKIRMDIPWGNPKRSELHFTAYDFSPGTATGLACQPCLHLTQGRGTSKHKATCSPLQDEATSLRNREVPWPPTFPLQLFPLSG